MWNDHFLVGDSFLYKPLNPFSALNSRQCCQYQVENSSTFRQTDCEGKERSAYNNTGNTNLEVFTLGSYLWFLRHEGTKSAVLLMISLRNMLWTFYEPLGSWSSVQIIFKLQAVLLPLLQLCTKLQWSFTHWMNERTNERTNKPKNEQIYEHVNDDSWRNVPSTKTGHLSYSTDNELHILW